MISVEEHPKKSIEVLGRRMACVELGEGPPVVFQHGNPTSSYLWRNVMPALAGRARCLAPDLIGMGDSDKLPDSGPGRYRFVEQRRYFEAALEALGVDEDVTLVGHDWGAALAFDWARRRPGAVRGIAYMEALVRPLTWEEWPERSRGLFRGFRSPAGESLVLEKNLFVERVLPGSVLRGLDEREMAVYRRPFLEPGESRRPTLTWPREIPIDGEPEDVRAIAAANAEWLASSEAPKLFVNAEPGAILTGAQREFCRGFRNQVEVGVAGAHFIQEDSPADLARALSDWFDTLG